MADTGIFATTAEVQYKAGTNASSTANVETYINSYMTQAESYINVASGINWSDIYAGLNVDVKGILKEAASNIAGGYVINFDKSGFTSVSEANSMIDYLWSRAEKCIELLKLEGARLFINNPISTT